MNTVKRKLIEFSVDHPWVVIVSAIVITIALALPIPNAVIDTDPENMLRADEPVRRIHAEIKGEFNLSDFLVLGFVGTGDLTTPDFIERLGLLVEAIEEMEGVVSEDIWAPSTVDDIYGTSDGTLVVGPLTDERIGWEGQQPSVMREHNGLSDVVGRGRLDDERWDPGCHGVPDQDRIVPALVACAQ